MNQALPAKLAWRLITQGSETWAKVVRAKYGLTEKGPLYFQSKQRSSMVWKGAVWGSKLLCNGLKWLAKNGNKIRFWLDRSVEDSPLVNGCTNQIQEDKIHMRVEEFWEGPSGWK